MLFGKKSKAEKQRDVREKIKHLSEEIGKIWNQGDMPNPFDVNGSYTGNTENNESPVQDADDL